jgi:hypothetical protein
MEVLNDYVVVLVLVVCLCVGFIIKQIVNNKVLNRFIPLIVGVLGIVVNLWIGGWALTPEAVAGGLVSGLASTGMYEMLRNFIEKK